MEELRVGSRGTENPKARRLREALVAVELAFVLVLVTQVGLIARTTWRLDRAEKGLAPEQVLTLRIDLPEAAYKDPERIRVFFARAVEQISALPGVVSAATVSTLPIADPPRSVPFAIEGRAIPLPESQLEAARVDISADFLRTMTIPVIGGRGLQSSDFGNAPPVVLASREAVRRFWPNEDAIGKRIAFDDDTRLWLEVVGVVGDVRNPNAGSPPLAQFYVPSSLQPDRAAVFVVKSSGPDPTQLAPSIRRQLAALEPNAPLHDINSMEREIMEDMGGTYLLTGMLCAIAVIALLLAAAGVYGLVAFAVSQRMREIGLRMALGAVPSAIVRLVVARGSIPVSVGLVFGTAASAFLISLTAAAMEEIDPRDPIAYAIVWVPLLMIALAATYIPARRAARVDPLVVLRHE
jgi:putative ABC transport system permease protein